METAILIISIIITIALCAAIVLLVLNIKKSSTKQKDPSEDLSLKEIGALSKQLEHMTTDLQKDMKYNLSLEMNKVLEQSNKTSESNNEKLERFQKNISESINTRFDSLNKTVDDKLAAINKKVDEKLQEGFKGTTETMTQVRERLQAIDDAQKNIENLSKDVVSLKTVLEGNQSRGQYGELQLSMVLHNVFGDTVGCYEEQHTLKRGHDGNDVRADAVVFLPEPNKKICIDSKFPFQDYARLFETDSETEKEKLTKDFGSAVKKHITVIKDKYIIDGKTAAQAIMFIPNDGVFAFVHHNLLDVVEYAREKQVIISSPSTLPAILVTINMVKLQYERNKHVKEISKQLTSLGKHFEIFAKDWEALSKQLDTATRTRERLDSRVTKITDRFDDISSNNQITTQDIPELE